jgi:hypothetical protein
LTFPGGLKVASGSSIQTFPFFIAIPGSTNLSNWKHWYHLEKMMKHDETCDKVINECVKMIQNPYPLILFLALAKTC